MQMAPHPLLLLYPINLVWRLIIPLPTLGMARRKPCTATSAPRLTRTLLGLPILVNLPLVLLWRNRPGYSTLKMPFRNTLALVARPMISCTPTELVDPHYV